MNVTVEILAPCKKLMRVEVEPAKVEETFEEITRQFQREAKFPGFRPGKAPKDMVVKRYESEIQDEVKMQVDLRFLSQGGGRPENHPGDHARY